MRLISGARWALVAVLIAGTGCGQKQMMLVQDQVKQLYRKGDWKGAASLYSKKDKDGKPEAFEPRDRVAYWLNLAMFLHMTEKFAESNDLLDKAVKRADELYTVSVSKVGASVLTNDTVQDYEGADYEILLTYPLSMLNYVALGEPQKALIQARALDERLKKLATKYPKKPVFNQDAFSRWLAGIIQESEGETNEALISYKNALVIYRDNYSPNFLFPIPRYLGEDIVRTATKLGGFEQDIQKVKTKYFKGDPDLGATTKVMKDRGEIILIHGSGEAPEKKDFYLTCNTKPISCTAGQGDAKAEMAKSLVSAGQDQVKMALPIMSVRPWRIAAAKMSIWAPGEMDKAKAGTDTGKHVGYGRIASITDPNQAKAMAEAQLQMAKDAGVRIDNDPEALGELRMHINLAILIFTHLYRLDASTRPYIETTLHQWAIEMNEILRRAEMAQRKRNADAEKDQPKALAGTGVKPGEALGPTLQAPVSVGWNEALTVMAQPVGAIAIKDHSDNLVRIFAKATARAVAKYLASKVAGGAAGAIAGKDSIWAKLFSFGTKAALNALEEADKRQWFALPAVYNVARYWAEPGEYDVQLTFYDASGNTVKTDVRKGVKVVAGKKTIINYRTIE